jgi:hypothetical protein
MPTPAAVYAAGPHRGVADQPADLDCYEAADELGDVVSR